MKKLICMILCVLMLIAAVPAMAVSADEPVTAKAFDDVKEGKWYYEGVMWCAEQGYMAGESDTLFAPSKEMTRAMLVTVLAAIAGVMLTMSLAVAGLAASMMMFKLIGWEELGMGLVTLAVAVGALAVATRTAQGSLLGAAAGLAVLAAGIILLAGSLILLSTLPWGPMAEGLVALTAGLTVIGLAAGIMKGLSGDSIKGLGTDLMKLAIGLGLMAGALLGILIGTLMA